MKSIKILTLFITISLFTIFSQSTAQAARDCSNPDGFHAKMMCAAAEKLGKDGSILKKDKAKKKAKKDKKKNTNSFNEKYKTLADLLKKKD